MLSGSVDEFPERAADAAPSCKRNPVGGWEDLQLNLDLTLEVSKKLTLELESTDLEAFSIGFGL
jgi:hypothetical protein